MKGIKKRQAKNRAKKEASEKYSKEQDLRKQYNLTP
jgi:hypothetical protein